MKDQGGLCKTTFGFFRQKFLSKRSIVVDETNPSLLRNIAKLNRRRFRGCSDSCLNNEKCFQQENKSNRKRTSQDSPMIQSRPTPSASATLLI